MLTLHQLRRCLPRPGRLEWIGLRSARRAPVLSVPEAEIHPLVGLLGDHGKVAPKAGEAAWAGQGKRQVTLLQAEHLPVVAALAGLDSVTPDLLRRNLLVGGLPLLALKDQRFWVGSVLLEGTGECHPCSRMEENLGPGGYNAVRGHGGITARVIAGGVVRVGDVVRPWTEEEEEAAAC
ncbi:MOSC domain-containing protein [Deinococcus lacus]|uniref:MOSC domain-containing protein n=1 Tax=Deinococcus lacus TaxID=392561 RepID=A0ABW1YCH7_9DEIO